MRHEFLPVLLASTGLMPAPDVSLICRNMSKIKDLGSTGIYAWTTLISCFICIPGAIYFEGPALKAGVDAAIAKVRLGVASGIPFE